MAAASCRMVFEAVMQANVGGGLNFRRLCFYIRAMLFNSILVASGFAEAQLNDNERHVQWHFIGNAHQG